MHKYTKLLGFVLSVIMLAYSPAYAIILGPNPVSSVPVGGYTWNPDGSTPQTVHLVWTINVQAIPINQSVVGLDEAIYSNTGNLNGTQPLLSNLAFNAYLFSIPNFVDEDSVKLMRIQVTPHQPVFLFRTASINVSSLIGNNDGNSVPSTPLGGTGGGLSAYQDFMFEPNPDFETGAMTLTFTVDPFGNSTLYYVIFDTWSFTPGTPVPEPATYLLLGSLLGVVFLAKVRRVAIR